jgi:uncharacterized protein
MNTDLERLIALQRLDTQAQDAHRRIAEEPERERALEARLEGARQALAEAKSALAANQAVRRELEKDLAQVQGRLSKFRDQIMEVKTNREYQAMQHEIAMAQKEVETKEGTLLERMLEADDLAAHLKRTEATLAAEQKAVEVDRNALVAEGRELTASISQIAVERAEVAKALDPQALAMFELVARRRNGVAVAEARDGVCTICHVRLRPQQFNTVLRNDQIVQCDSCNRILYSARGPAAENASPPAQ